jgi:hypothetical protein
VQNAIQSLLLKTRLREIFPKKFFGNGTLIRGKFTEVLGGIYTPRRVLRGRVATSDDFRPEGCYSEGHFRQFDPWPPRPF